MARILVRFRVGFASGTCDYRLRPSSFVTSGLLHAAVIVAAVFAPAPLRHGAEVRRPIYDTYIRPEEKRIVWYRFPKTLPQVAGAKVPYAPQFHGRKQSSQVIIAMSDSQTRSNQLIWRPDRPPTISAEIESPNLIALATPDVAPAPKQKQFTPPPTRSTRSLATPAEQLKAPDLDVGAAVTTAPILKARQFVAPPPRVREAEPAPAIPVPNVSVDASADERGSNAMRQLRAAIAPPPSRITVPASGASASGSGVPGTGTGNQGGSAAGRGAGAAGGTPQAGGATVAVVGLNPSDRGPGTLPDGARPGQFSTAPTVGSPGAPGNGGGIHVPGLRVEGTPGNAGSSAIASAHAAGMPAGKPVLYTETTAGPMPSTFSVPLHPSSRSIPRSIESRFHDRTVYAVVIPAPVLPEYTGDWTLWFAERGSGIGASRIRAPLPYRKIQPSGTAAKHGGIERHMLIPILIAKNGAVQPLDASMASERAIEDLRCWEFRPATRNGSPVDVEAVLDFVFRDAQ